MSTALTPAWRVHVGTAAVTSVRFAVPHPRARDPWPLSRVVMSVTALGAERCDRPHAVGAGRGVPILHRQAMTWQGCALHLEAQRLQDTAEVALELPPWDELSDAVDDEDTLWRLIDTVAEACDARWGAIGDGEALGAAPDLRRHAGVLLSESAAQDVAGIRPYTVLPHSGLAVLLR